MFRLAMVFGASVILTCVGVAVPVPSSWTTFRLNPQLDPVLEAGITPDWTVQTHGPISSSPTIVGDTLYIGNNANRLYAIDVRTGTVRWTATAQAPLMSAPLVDDGLVIVGEGNANSTTYVPRREVVVGSGASGLLAYDASTGRLVWQVPLQGTAMPTPAIVDGVLVQHNGDGGLIAVDPKTGAVKWRSIPKSIASMSGALPIGNGIVASAGIYPNRVFAFRVANGSIVWSYDLNSGDTGVGDCPPATDGRRIFGDYISAPNAGGLAGVGIVGVERAYGLDASDGKPLWNVALETGMVPPRNEAAIPLVYQNRLYLGSSIAPDVHALDPATGALLWRRRVNGPVKGGMVGIDGSVYFGDLGGNLWALDAANGNVEGVLHTGTPFNVGSPIVVGGSLIIGSVTGAVEAVPLARIRGAR